MVLDAFGGSLIRAETDDQGHYEINLPAGLNSLYLASIPNESDYQTGAVHWELNIAAGKIVEGSPDFQLKRRPALKAPGTPALAKGRIVDPEGHPVAGVQISYQRHPLKGAEDYSDEWYGFSGPSTSSDTDGVYVLNLAPFCEYEITAGGQATSAAKSKKFKTDAGSSHQIEDLVVRPADAIAEGVVVDETGKPLASAVLDTSSENKASACYSNVTSDASGRFHIDHLLPDEPFTVVVNKAGYGEMKKTLSPGDTGIRVVLASEK